MSISTPEELKELPPSSDLFNVEHFFEFCSRLTIESKEKGRTKLHLLGTQKYFIEELARGLSVGQHTFIVLKGRQLGLTTITYALTLYWNQKNKGLQGAMVSDTDKNNIKARTMLSNYHESLPRGFKVTIKENNRNHILFTNGSRIAFLVAGTKKKSEMGTGEAINFLHATECSSWGNEEGVQNLMATLAQSNPNRLYIFESTARGYNIFTDMWDEAKESRFKRAVFIGWWRNELYRKEKDSEEFEIYWDGHLTTEENIWVKEILETYGFTIEPEQIAWWRWFMHEELKDDNVRMYQEFPPTEDYAFQMSGSKFFSAVSLNNTYKEIKNIPSIFFTYQMGEYFELTQLFETNEDNAELTIWENYDPSGYYVVGADPAYGSSSWADRFVATVWRCYADRVVQVAEYCNDSCSTYQFAWVCAHLCGEYGGAMLNLEINGPGTAVFNELRNLSRLASISTKNSDRNSIYNIVGRIKHYLYQRQDSMSGQFAYQWQTNYKEKERMFNTMRDYYERGMVVVRSKELIKEMKRIVRIDGEIGGESTSKDDRVVGACLACICWNDKIMHGLIRDGKTFEAESREKEWGKNATQLSRMARNMIEMTRRK